MGKCVGARSPAVHAMWISSGVPVYQMRFFIHDSRGCRASFDRSSDEDRPGTDERSTRMTTDRREPTKDRLRIDETSTEEAKGQCLPDLGRTGAPVAATARSRAADERRRVNVCRISGSNSSTRSSYREESRGGWDAKGQCLPDFGARPYGAAIIQNARTDGLIGQTDSLLQRPPNSTAAIQRTPRRSGMIQR